jgi:DNA-binding Xre family transcriptional regulator
MLEIRCDVWYNAKSIAIINEVEARCDIAASYNKLFKLLIDKKMKKGELCRAADISGTSLAKLVRGESVITEILIKICRVLQCDFADIMELEPDNMETETVK